MSSTDENKWAWLNRCPPPTHLTPTLLTTHLTYGTVMYTVREHCSNPRFWLTSSTGEMFWLNHIMTLQHEQLAEPSNGFQNWLGNCLLYQPSSECVWKHVRFLQTCSLNTNRTQYNALLECRIPYAHHTALPWSSSVCTRNWVKLTYGYTYAEITA